MTITCPTPSMSRLRPRPRGLHRLATAAALALPLAVAAQGADKPVRGGTLVIPVHFAEPSTYDCHGSAPTASFRLSPHYSTLLRLDADRYPNVAPELAPSWTISPDGLTYEFKLAANVKFHDGTALSATDVKASLDRMRNPPPGVFSRQRVMYDDIAQIDVPDATTVVIRLKQPNAAMLQLLAVPTACIYSAKLMASDPSYPAKKVMGSGPFRFVRHIAGSEWVGERFDGYFKAGLPHLDGFRALSVTSTAAVNAMASGQVHYTLRGLPPDDADRIKAARGDRVRLVGGQQATGVTQLIAFNTQHPALADERVRRALSLAIDRRAGSKALQKFTAVHLMGGLIAPGSTFARTDKELEELPGFGRDIEANRREARRLLAEAGHADLKIGFLNRKDSPFYGVFLVDQLRQIGVTVDHQLTEMPVLTQRTKNGDYDLVLTAQLEFLHDPIVQLSSWRPFKNNPSNHARTDDPRLDELFIAQMRELDPAKRELKVQEMEKYIVERAYVAPFYWQSWRRAISSDVGGLGDMPSNMLKTDLQDIWLRSGGKSTP